MLWEVDLRFRSVDSDGTDMRVLVRGSFVERVIETCHRKYPDGQILCVMPSPIDELCPDTYVVGENNG